MNLIFSVMVGLASITPISAQDLNYEASVLPVGYGNQVEWKYTTTIPDTTWFETSFKDSLWDLGQGGFGTYSISHTPWNTADIWIRKSFNVKGLDALIKQDLELKIFHDQDAEVYINGIQVLVKEGYNTRYELDALTDSAKAVLVEGNNVIAVHCSNTVGGPGYLDVGLVTISSFTNDELVSSSGDKLWNFTTTDPATLDWVKPNYVIAGWDTGTGAFGYNFPDPLGVVNTAWSTADIWLRKAFTGNFTAYANLLLRIQNSDNAEVYLNGTLVFTGVGSNQELGAMEVYLPPQFSALIKPGQNVIAVHCQNNSGTGIIDVSLSGAVAHDATGIQISHQSHIQTNRKSHLLFNRALGRDRVQVIIPDKYLIFDLKGRGF